MIAQEVMEKRTRMIRTIWDNSDDRAISPRTSPPRPSSDDALTPGVSATEKFVELYSEFGVTLMSKGLPLARACEDDDTQAALLLLASDQGSYITGATLNVDGGMTSTFSAGG